MLLEKNGTQSSSKRTKHIRVRYFFIKDRIGNGDKSLKHCPTGDMVGDHFTKPLQGAQFQKFCADIQGVPTDMSDLDMGLGQDEMTKAGPSPQQCVEKPGKDPRANDSGSKIYRTVAQGAGARGARPTQPMFSEQTNDATPLADRARSRRELVAPLRRASEGSPSANRHGEGRATQRRLMESSPSKSHSFLIL
jgi:hypothetical protein